MSQMPWFAPACWGSLAVPLSQAGSWFQLLGCLESGTLDDFRPSEKELAVWEES